MSSQTFELKTAIYRAGAGAGKTTKLVSHVLETVQSFYRIHQRFPKLVVTTFTRKATQELRERLLIEGQKIGNADLLNYIMSKSDLHISTIHGVLNLLLARYGSRLGFPPGVQFLSAEESTKRTKKILRQIVARSDVNELVSELGFSNLSLFVKNYYRSSLTSGSIQPSSLENLESAIANYLTSFSSKIFEHADQLASSSTGEDWRDFVLKLRRLAELLSDDSVGKYSEWRSLYEDLQMPRTKKGGPSDEARESFKKMWKSLDVLKSDYLNPSIVGRAVECFAVLDEIGRKYFEAAIADRKMTGQIEIEDLELLSLKLLTEHPDVAIQFSEERDYWLVDEFQDTSPLQVELLHKLIQKRPHFIVGDPQQSIYFFRGARAEVFDQKERAIEQQGGLLASLQTNYRSRPELLSFLNDLVEKFGFIRMQPREEKFDPTFEVARIGIFEAAEEELNFISQEIVNLIQTGVPLEKICILMKKNKDLEICARHLSLHGISVQVHSASGFYNRREILDLISMLKFLVNPHDNKNLIQLLRSPWARIEDQVLAEWIGGLKKDQSFWNIFKEQPHEIVQELVTTLEDVRRQGIVAAFERWVVNSGIIDFSHYHDSTGQRESNIWKFLNQLREKSIEPGFVVQKFLLNTISATDLDDYEGDSDAVAAFEPNRVNLMTVHMSKGLQFDYVFVPKLGQKKSRAKRPRFFTQNGIWMCDLPLGEDDKSIGMLPSEVERERLDAAETEELWRVFYVAVTRARERLYLSTSEKAQSPSWWDRFNLDLSGPRTQTDQYSYSVVRELEEVKINRLKSEGRRETYRPLILKKGAGVQTLSVSRVLEGLAWQKSKTDTQDLYSRVGRTARGVLVHRVFESLHYLGPSRLQEVLDSLFEKEQVQVNQAVQYVLGNKEVPLKELIDNGFVEWGFLLREEGFTLEGQIDLWGHADGKLWVVDYKTGRIENAEKAFEQLSLYALALHLRGEQGSIEMAVVFPFENKTLTRSITVPDLQRLRRRLADAIRDQSQYKELSPG